MTKKNKTILLLAVAAVVWGYTGLKWFNYFSIEGDNEVSFNFDQSAIPDIVYEEKQDFKLNASYPDPFLKNRKYKVTSSVSSPKLNYNRVSNPNPNKVVANQVETNNYKWPELKYSGFILSKGEKLGLLNLSGQDILAKRGDIHQQILINEIYADSIRLQSGESVTTIFKN